MFILCDGEEKSALTQGLARAQATPTSATADACPFSGTGRLLMGPRLPARTVTGTQALPVVGAAAAPQLGLRRCRGTDVEMTSSVWCLACSACTCPQALGCVEATWWSLRGPGRNADVTGFLLRHSADHSGHIPSGPGGQFAPVFWA